MNQKYLFFIIISLMYFSVICAIKCYECQDVPPLIRNCSKMDESITGVVLSDCAPDMDACQTIVTRVYSEKVMLRVCGTNDCKSVMGITGLPHEVFISCQVCYENGCNNVIM